MAGAQNAFGFLKVLLVQFNSFVEPTRVPVGVGEVMA